MPRTLVLIAGPALAVPLALALWWWAGQSPAVALTAGITTLVAIWWVFEPIPIPATSLIPIALFPAFGVLTPTQVAEAYGSPLILLLLGGFMLSTAMERSGAHRRIALGMVNLVGGGSCRRLVFGFMIASAVLSMWISNTATTLMLLPIALAVVEKIEDRRVGIALLLGVAYAASVGGTGTPIGTPPNLVFMRVYQENTGVEIGFTQWMRWALPIVIVMIPLTWLWLTRNVPRRLEVTLPEVGQWRTEEIRTLIVFAITAVLWMTRREPFGGWSEWLGLQGANDASVALTAVVAMFLIPNGRGSALLDWESANRIPWGILILFGSGIAIAKAFTVSGLSATLGGALAGLGALPLLLLIGLVCVSVTFLTEFTSNTATTTLLMPILATGAIAAGIEPRLIMVPAAISASFAFMLPVATGPNAVIYSSGQFSVKRMAREGFALNLLGTVVISALTYTLLA